MSDFSKDEESLILKIQKLLALAASDNENEAKSAAEKAQALLVKFNLNIQQVRGMDLEYMETKIANEPYLRWHQPFLIDILQEYFFVKVMWYNVPHKLTRDGRMQKRKDIVLIGTKANVKIAHYVFDYLSGVYQRLWLEYKKDNNVGEKSRKSYYTGLSIGLSRKLETVREKVQQEAGLVLVADPKLEEKLKDVKCHKNNYKTERDRNAEIDGYQDGQKIEINKPIESNTTNSGKALTSGK